MYNFFGVDTDESRSEYLKKETRIVNENSTDELLQPGLGANSDNDVPRRRYQVKLCVLWYF